MLERIFVCFCESTLYLGPGTLSVHTFRFPLEPFGHIWNCPYILFPLEPCLSIHFVPSGTLSVHTFCSLWNPVCPYILFPLEPCLSIPFVPSGPCLPIRFGPWKPVCPYNLVPSGTLSVHTFYSPWGPDYIVQYIAIIAIIDWLCNFIAIIDWRSTIILQ